MKQVKSTFYQNKYTLLIIETYFCNDEQEHFQILFQMDDFPAMQGSCQSLRDWFCGRRSPLVLLFVEQNGVFCWTSAPKFVKRCWWNGGIDAFSKESV